MVVRLAVLDIIEDAENVDDYGTVSTAYQEHIRSLLTKIDETGDVTDTVSAYERERKEKY